MRVHTNIIAIWKVLYSIFVTHTFPLCGSTVVKIKKVKIQENIAQNYVNSFLWNSLFHRGS